MSHSTGAVHPPAAPAHPTASAPSPSESTTALTQALESFLEEFWTRQMEVVEEEEPDFKNVGLPLARIKKVMKSDEEVKMISSEGE